MSDKLQLKLDSFDAVIFDMDGTMVDNMEYHKKAWIAFLKKHGMEITEEEFKKRFSGKKNEHLVKMVFGDALSHEEIERHSEDKEALYREFYAPEIEPVPGLHEIIETLKKAHKKLAVATTAPRKNRDFGFKALGLENAFAVVLGDEHVTNGKPHPEIYLETAKKLGVTPDRCLVFEDSPSGVGAGKNAKMKVVGILTTHSKEELKDADYLVKDFSDITFE